MSKTNLRYLEFLKHSDTYAYKVRIFAFVHSYIFFLGLVSLATIFIFNIHRNEIPFWSFLSVFSLLVIELSLRIKSHTGLMKFTNGVLSVYTFLFIPMGLYQTGSIASPGSLLVLVIVGLVALLGSGRINIIRIIFILTVCIFFVLLEYFAPQSKLLQNSFDLSILDWILPFSLVLLFTYRLISKIRVLIEDNENVMMVQKDVLHRMSLMDPLTGLYNRRWLDETLTRLISDLKREGRTFVIITIDIDFFKKYNDTYGHIQGDICLKDVASILSNDLDHTTDHAFRFGGEEFVLLLESTDSDGARKVVRTIRKNLEKAGIEHKASSVKSVLTISMGLVEIGSAQSGLWLKELLHYSDLALYKAKEEGRDQCWGYDGNGYWKIEG